MQGLWPQGGHFGFNSLLYPSKHLPVNIAAYLGHAHKLGQIEVRFVPEDKVVSSLGGYGHPVTQPVCHKWQQALCEWEHFKRRPQETWEL